LTDYWKFNPRAGEKKSGKNCYLQFEHHIQHAF
jgi:hypothetical protein